MTDRSGSLNPKIVPNFVCQPHFSKVGSLSVDVLGIFATMLKGDMWSKKYFSMERMRWNCSGMRDSISSALSMMIEILPEYFIYAEKSL